MSWALIYDQKLVSTPVDWRSHLPIPRQIVPGTHSFSALTIKTTSVSALPSWWLALDLLIGVEDTTHPETPIIHEIHKIKLNDLIRVSPSAAPYSLIIEIPDYFQDAQVRIWGKE